MFDKKILILGMLSCFQNFFSQVNDSVPIANPLKEITISAMHINDSLMNAPAAIGILSEKELQRNNATDISAAANLIPGVLMQSANVTTNRISIRGIGARTPYGTNKIRAFYGNIPLTSGDSETTIDDIDLENIDQVEIIKGPLSSIYGAGLGGAILISPKLYEKSGSQLKLSTVYGSFGLKKNTVNYSLNQKKGSLNLSYHKLQSDGWRENSSYYREGVTLGGELFRRKDSKLTYFGNYIYLKAFLPSSIDKKTFDESPRSAAATWRDSKGYKQYNTFMGGLSYDWKISESIKNSTTIFINYKDNNEPRPFDLLKQYTFAYGARTQFSGSFDVFKTPVTFNTGLEYFTDAYSGRTLENLYKENNGLGSLQGDLLTATQQNRSFYNAFAQFRVPIAKKFELQAGLNVNQTKFTLDNTIPEGSAENYSYEMIWSPQISVLFKPSNLQTVYLSASKGFSLPSVTETLTASGTINAGIKPESGYNYELGGKFYFLNRTLFTEVALYRMEIDNLLVAQRISDDQYVGRNAGETLHQGLEISMKYHWQINRVFSLDPYLSASVGEYKFVEFNNLGTDFSRNKLTGVPANTATSGFTLNTNFGWYFSGDFRFADKIPLNDANENFTDAYQILDLKTGYRFEIFQNLNANVAAGINNVTDEKYASLILPNAVANGNAAPRFYYPGLPVHYYGSFSIAYNF